MANNVDPDQTAPIGWSIIYWVYQGVTGYNFQINLFLSLKIVFVLANSVDPAALCNISSGSSLLAKVHI